MRNVVIALIAVVVLCMASVVGVAQVGTPDLAGLKLVTQLPREVPQRISGLAFDGEKLWATIYSAGGRYATLDPSTLTWRTEFEKNQYNAIRKVAGGSSSPGGICFINGKLWIGGSYGDSFGSIDPATWKVEQIFTGKQRQDEASQSYSSLAFDGTYLWIAWHWCRYDIPATETQLLLKVDAQTGKILAEYPAAEGSAPDLTHGLTWDGSRLWHMKDNRLSAIDPTTGRVTAAYRLDEIKRASGLAWVNDSLWIAEFAGQIWQLPFSR